MRTPWKRALLVLLAGLGTGFVTQLLQSALPTGWSQVANAISPWLLVAFLVGAAMPDRGSAIVAGLATLVLALIGYYATTQLRYGIGGGTNALIFWGLGAAVGGPVFGFAGHVWRTGEHRNRALALGLLAAVFIAEGGYHLLALSEPGVAVGFVIAGLLVPVRARAIPRGSPLGVCSGPPGPRPRRRRVRRVHLALRHHVTNPGLTTARYQPGYSRADAAGLVGSNSPGSTAMQHWGCYLAINPGPGLADDYAG